MSWKNRRRSYINNFIQKCAAPMPKPVSVEDIASQSFSLTSVGGRLNPKRVPLMVCLWFRWVPIFSPLFIWPVCRKVHCIEREFPFLIFKTLGLVVITFGGPHSLQSLPLMSNNPSITITSYLHWGSPHLQSSQHHRNHSNISIYNSTFRPRFCLHFTFKHLCVSYIVIVCI